MRKIYVNGTQIRALDTRPMRVLEELIISRTQVKFLSTTGLASLRGLGINETQIGRIHIVSGWKIEELWIVNSGIRFIDGRERMQVEYLIKNDDQTVLHDKWRRRLPSLVLWGVSWKMKSPDGSVLYYVVTGTSAQNEEREIEPWKRQEGEGGR